MQHGLSLLLNEHVRAADITHKDCETFQIVCPACREPTFKVEQQWPDGVRHYISHYRADKALNAECEFRVKGLADSDLERSNALSRDQKIRHFLEVLQSAVVRHVWPAEHRNSIRRAIRDMNKKRHLIHLREALLRSSGPCALIENFNEIADTYYRDAGRPETTFAETVQRQIALDMYRHALTPKARSSFDVLFNSAFLWLVARMENAIRVGSITPASRRLYDHAGRLISSSGNGGFAVLQQMMAEIAYPPFVEEPIPYLQKLAAEISHEMIGILLRLPYFEILKEQIAERPRRQNA